MRYYSNNASEMTLQSSVSEADTSFALDDVTGLPPSFPFILVVDVAQTNEEVVLCTNIVGETATVTRGYNNTAATAHAAAAKIRHMSVALDFSESQEHINNSSAVHGVSGDVVGTTDTQVLANKTIDGLNNTLTNLPSAALPANVVYLATSQTLTGKSMSGATNTFTNIPSSALPAAVVYLTDTQTLTNKSIDGATNTLTNLPATALTGTIAEGRLPAAVYSYREQTSSEAVAGTGTFETVSTFSTSPAWCGQSGITYSAGTWTLPTTGRYLVTLSLTFEAHATGKRYLRARLGTDVIASNSVPGGTGGDDVVALSREFLATAAQVVTFEGAQNSGSTINTVAGPGTYAIFRYLGPA